MSNESSSGVGVFTVVGIVFIILKLCNVIAWSWWVVLIPFYPAVLGIVLLIIFALVVAIKD